MTIPLACVLVAFVLVYAVKVPIAIAQERSQGGYDNANPREQQARLEGWGKRAVAAHQNGFEGFPPFAAAVLTAHVAHANPTWATWLALTYVGVRILYPVLYITDRGTPRTIVWTLGFLATCGLFVLPLLS